MTDQDREDRALEIALAAAQSAHRHLVEGGLEPPPRETRSWLRIGADGAFERIDMFDARQREKTLQAQRKRSEAEQKLPPLATDGRDGQTDRSAQPGRCLDWTQRVVAISARQMKQRGHSD